MQYKWNVEKVNTVGDNNLIQTVFLTFTATKENVSETYQCIKILQPSNTFIAYDQLIEQQILNWCFEPQITEVKNQNNQVVETITRRIKEETEAFVSANVERQLAQLAVSPALPWVVAELNKNIAAQAAATP